jgi:CheY-like chemotaxis protein
VQQAFLQADPARIDQMVNNLVDNAIRYSPAGSRIDIRVTVEDGEAVLQVSDAGIGIAPDLLARVFDPFVQANRALDRSQGGLGVGLTLVRKLAELHGGSASAASEGEGRGSTFTVRLPLSAAQPERPAAESSTMGGKKKVLVIEDNPDAREVTCVLLEMHGYQVFKAPNGTDGIRTARIEKPDVAVIDIGLPDVNGYEVARRLRTDPETRGTGLIALTGYGSEEDVRRSMEAGFDVHLKKPVQVDRLANAVQISIAASGRHADQLE